MNDVAFENMTVIELRKVAKDMGVKLHAGISKQGIVDLLNEASGTPAGQQMNKTENSPKVTDDPVYPPLSMIDAAEDSDTTLTGTPTGHPVRHAAIIADDETDDESGVLPQWNANQRTFTPPRLPDTRPSVPSMTAASSSAGTATASKAPTFNVEGSRSWHNPRPFNANSAPRPNYQNPVQGSWLQRTTPPVRTQQPEPYSALRSGPSRFGPAEETPAEMSVPAAAMQAVDPAVAPADLGDAFGFVDVQAEGHAFMRVDGLMPGRGDVLVPAALVKRFHLRTGDTISGKTRPPSDTTRCYTMAFLTEINGKEPDETLIRPFFDDLTAIYPKVRIPLGIGRNADRALRLPDLLCPLGFGQRAVVMAPSRSGKTTLFQKISEAVKENAPSTEIIMLLIDAKPEEVTEIRESVDGKVYACLFDQPAENAVKMAEMVLEKAERMVEEKKNVILLIDNLTRLARDANSAAPASARVMPSGLAAGCLVKPKRILAAARNTREAGTLTVIAIESTNTGNTIDDAIIDEFRGLANLEWVLLRSASEKRTFPIFDFSKCANRRGDVMLSDAENRAAAEIRSRIAGKSPVEAIQIQDKLLDESSDNETLVQQMCRK